MNFIVINRPQRLTLAASLAYVLVTSSALAAPAIPAAPSYDPGQMQQRLELPQQLPPVGGEPTVQVPESTGQAMPEGVEFTLNSVDIEGATVFTAAELRPDYEQYLGKKISLKTLGEVADKITVHYRNAGYILSRALVPPQSIKGGNAVIRVVEGYVSHVQFVGSGQSSIRPLLDQYGDNIREAKPLDAATLERYLLLMQDLPGMTARAVLQPSAATPGAADLVVNVAETPVDGSATLDNRGSRYVGPIQGGITASLNDPFGLYDRTQFHGVSTAENNELHYAQFLQEEQLDADGTKLSLSFAHTNSHPAYKLSQFDIESQDNDFSAAISHPFLRSRISNLYGTVTLEARETAVDTLGTLDYQDRVRVVRANAAYDFVDNTSAVNRVSSTLSKGFSLDSSSSNGVYSRLNADPDFMKAEGQFSRLQPIDGPFSLYGAFTGQYSADTLFSSEEFGLGGPNFGSAYDPSELTGDSGFAVRGELQYSRDGDFEWVPNYQTYAFWDFGKVWIRDQSLGVSDSPSLASAGIGLRFNASEPLSGGVELAFPLTKQVTADGQDGNRPRVFFSLAYRF